MRSIGRILFASFKIFALVFAMLCTYLYVSDKVTLFSTTQEYVTRRCSGAHDMPAVCDCYNYYGRHCLSDKRLMWDIQPDEEEGN